ncbi:MAG: hypothetical protein WBM39_06225 [Parasphingorhabdus sp.]
MNAYIASFMLLLFNAVGLAVPASAAAEERMMPELGSAANLSEAAVADLCSAVEQAGLRSTDHQPCGIAEVSVSRSPVLDKTASNDQAWAVLATRSEAGNKLEHEEGAP